MKSLRRGARLRQGAKAATDRRTHDHFAELGRKGGETTGKSKLRGDSEYYRRIVRKRWTKDTRRKNAKPK